MNKILTLEQTHTIRKNVNSYLQKINNEPINRRMHKIGSLQKAIAKYIINLGVSNNDDLKEVKITIPMLEEDSSLLVFIANSITNYTGNSHTYKPVTANKGYNLYQIHRN